MNGNYYRPCMRRGNVFVVSVCVSVQAVTFEADGIETFILAQWWMSTISRSSLSTKVKVKTSWWLAFG